MKQHYADFGCNENVDKLCNAQKHKRFGSMFTQKDFQFLLI